MSLIILDIGTGFEKAATTIITIIIVLLLFSLFGYKYFCKTTTKKWKAGLITMSLCLVIANTGLFLINKVKGGIPFQSFFDKELITLSFITSTLAIVVTFALTIIDSIKEKE